MANLSIREAVKYYQVSRPTLTKALKSGKLSGTQDGQGKWSIDPSELARVYRSRTDTSDASEKFFTGQSATILATQNTSGPTELEALRAQLVEVELRAVKAETRADAAELLAKERAERIEDLRRMLPSPETSKKRRWWQRR
ncbi:helix-turn-helix domain-containing protein [uncultured Jannaschia sp.]|uniref:helix-turn-helix domain-containing protein n=1 Tax=uncultured Jannaschia sp. TaxID=293347 RepID=UPI002621C402|nr:helix-turn-helix domain-containing protein [uncultured Jannaschia sp.]